MITKEIKARILAASNAVIDAEKKKGSAYLEMANALAEGYGKDWYELETKPNKTEEEKQRVAALREERKGFTALCEKRGINANAAWQNVKEKHQPKKAKGAHDTTPRTLETFSLESIPAGLRRAAKDDNLETPEHIHMLWADIETAFLKHVPKMTRTKIYGEA